MIRMPYTWMLPLDAVAFPAHDATQTAVVHELFHVLVDAVPRCCRSRGRPPSPRSQLARLDTGEPNDVLVTTAFCNAGNMPDSVFDDMEEFMNDRCVRGVVSCERGGVTGNIHVQGVLAVAVRSSFPTRRG